MEARVGVSSTPGRGLVEEARNMGADYLVIGGETKRSNRSDSNSFMQKLWTKISRITFVTLSSSTRAKPAVSNYCCKNVPEGCSLVMLRRAADRRQKQDSCGKFN